MRSPLAATASLRAEASERRVSPPPLGWSRPERRSQAYSSPGCRWRECANAAEHVTPRMRENKQEKKKQNRVHTRRIDGHGYRGKAVGNNESTNNVPVPAGLESLCRSATGERRDNVRYAKNKEIITASRRALFLRRHAAEKNDAGSAEPRGLYLFFSCGTGQRTRESRVHDS